MGKALKSAVLATALMLLVLAAGHSGTAHAQGIDQRMQETFNSMVNVTDPKIHMGARRGVISGGGLVVKNRVMNASVFNFQPPHAKFGCGGWDLFAGSFSFISSEQIVAMLRSVASAAVAYAFKLALSTISKDVANTLDELWQNMSKLNAMQINSCKIGEILVNSAAGRNDQSQGDGLGRQLLSAMGWRDDDSDAQNQGEASSPAQHVAQNHPDVREIVVKGNHVWKALHGQGAAWWFGTEDRQMLEHIMSMTGTIIVCAPGVDNCPLPMQATTGQETLFTAFKEATLTLKNLVKGANSYANVRVYRCNETWQCLDPYPSMDSTFIGTEQILLDRLLGPTRAEGDGLIGRYAQNAGSPSSQELALLTNGGAYVSMAMNIAARNETAARLFVNDFSEVMAAEMTAAVVDELLASTIEASAAMEGGGMRDAQKLVLAARSNIRDDLKAFHDQATANAEKFVYYKMLMDSLEAPHVPAAAVTQN